MMMMTATRMPGHGVAVCTACICCCLSHFNSALPSPPKSDLSQLELLGNLSHRGGCASGSELARGPRLPRDELRAPFQYTTSQCSANTGGRPQPPCLQHLRVRSHLHAPLHILWLDSVPSPRTNNTTQQ
eukprot:348204-Rhodomonas_salina.1